MTAKTLTIPVVNRDDLISNAPLRGLSAEEKLAWLKLRTSVVPVTLLIAVSTDLGRFEIEYRYARDHGRVEKAIELTHGAFRAFRRNGMLARVNLRRAGPRKAAKAHAEVAELLGSIAAYARSLPPDYKDRWKLLVTSVLALEHWRTEKTVLSQALVAPSLTPE